MFSYIYIYMCIFIYIEAPQNKVFMLVPMLIDCIKWETRSFKRCSSAVVHVPRATAEPLMKRSQFLSLNLSQSRIF